MEAEMHEPLSILVGGEIWDLYVHGVTRVASDWWVQIAVVGPRCCTATVRVDTANGRGPAARQIINLISAWLRRDEASAHVFLEDPTREARAS
jgi:hypothetical protein